MYVPRKPSLRWRGFHYASAHTYYVTVCVQDRRCRFGRIIDGAVELNLAGEMLQRIWLQIPGAFPTARVGAYVIMPNHVHGLIRIIDRPRPHPRASAPRLSDLIGWWKGWTTSAYASGVARGQWPRFDGRLWQRGYYDRVIRDEDEHGRAEGYIRRNPQRWDDDPHNPERRT